ncbi:MAG: sugar ABC transporter substrate-binding protein [Lachnospiraceae bacterium]|nr:sugar ABC transporter substrate-binding protein [Lachnospiraceae bacterium]
MKKKLLSTALAGIMVMSLAACGGGGGNSGGGSADGGDAAGGASSGGDKGGTITVAIWDNGQKAGLDQIIADYTAATGNKAEIQVITWDQYWTLLEAGASGGDMPDVFWMHSNEVQKYMENDILMDLTDRIASSEKLEMDKFPEDIKNLYSWNGKTYAIPKDVDTIALFYNKTMFDEAGLSYPDDSWTWDDFYDAAVKLTKEDGSQYGTAMNPSNEQDGWMNIIYSMGGKVLTDDKKASGFDDPNTIKAMEFVQKLVDNVMPPATVMAETGTDVLLGSGKIAMLSQGSWMVPQFKEHEYISANCDVAVLPKDPTTGNRVSLYNGLGWAVSAKTKNPDAAWQLVEWFGTKDMQLKQAQLGVTMAAYDGVSDEWKNNTDKFDLQPFLDMRENIVFRPSTRATLTWWNPMCETFKEAWNGNMPMADACAQVTQQMNEAISAE